MKNRLLYLLLMLPALMFSQPIEQYQQFNGRYTYTVIGNTLNVGENNGTNCSINTQSSAILNLPSNDGIIAALLYWSGSGSGDFDVKLNGVDITAERTFLQNNNSLDYFAAFADVSDLIINNGNGNYTLSELDLTSVITTYCTNATNYGGWSIVIIYKDNNLPLNQLAVFDGFELVSISNPNLDFVLGNINIENTSNAKIGFLAWEGDSNISITESLTINGNVVANPPLNPSDNAFNSTDSYSGSNTLYNMDQDQYDMSGFVNIGDNSINIGLTTGQDLILVNNVITLVNSELPDATILPNGSVSTCDGESIELNYEVRNVNSTNVLPANTPIIVFEDNNFLTEIQTTTNIPIGGSEFGSVTVPIPGGVPSSFELRLVVDEDMSGNNFVDETNEANNEFTVQVSVVNNQPPEVFVVSDLEVNDPEGDGFEIFDLTVKIPEILGTQDPADVDVIFYETQTDAFNNTNAITDPSAYQNVVNPQTIYVRLQNTANSCFALNNFLIVAVSDLGVGYQLLNEIRIHPNPTTGAVRLISELPIKGEVIVYDLQGRKIWSKMIPEGASEVDIDLSSVKSGIYMVEFNSGINSSSFKVIKK